MPEVGGRIAVGVLGWVLVVVALLAMVSRWVRSSWPPVIALAAACPLTLLLMTVAILLFLVVRHWWGLSMAVLVLGLQALAIVPLYLPDANPRGVAVTVLQTNVQSGRVDPSALMAAIRENDATVVTINGLTVESRDRLVAAHIDSLFPYSYTIAEPNAAGTGIWSRYPLTPVHQEDRSYAFRQVWAEAQIPQVGPVMIVAVHIRPPDSADASTAWLAELDTLGRQFRALRPDVKVIVGGDFNATYDHFAFRQLLTNGYSDAASQAGAGLVPTWCDGHWFTRLFGIDHVLTRGAVASMVKTESIYGLTHRAVVATVVLNEPTN